MRALFLIPRADPPTLKKKDRWTPNFNHFIAQCTVKDYKDRPTVKTLLEVRHDVTNILL